MWWKAGLRVPEDLACVIVGDDLLTCGNDFPSLTSVDYPAEAIGYEAAATLHKMLQGQAVPPTRLLAPTGVTVRASTDVLAVNAPVVMEALQHIRRNAHRPVSVITAARRSSSGPRRRAILPIANAPTKISPW